VARSKLDQLYAERDARESLTHGADVEVYALGGWCNGYVVIGLAEACVYAQKVLNATEHGAIHQGRRLEPMRLEYSDVRLAKTA
jgi:hypothetical protein